jgi:hypothetical protein
METYKVLQKLGKQDDASDCICYTEGWYKAISMGIQPIKAPTAFPT